MELRGKCISYASYIKKIKDKTEINIKKEILNLEQNYSEENLVRIDDLKTQLETIRTEKLEGSIIRSRARWISEGEKPSHYFLSLESRNFTNKIIPKLELADGKTVESQENILNETMKFYSNLYKEKEINAELDLNEILDQYNPPKLSHEESLKLEGNITLQETLTVLKAMKRNKSPGSDGFSSEFFKVFWNKLGPFIVRSLNYGYSTGELSITQKEGIIVCIPKENKPKQFLKNWRPITLLNTVYKLGSGVIANRIKTVLDKLISKDQTGFMAGRYIGENTRLIYDLLDYTEERNIPGLLLFIDFEKAFDSVSWKFLDKTLHFFNFGESIRKWVSVFYNNIKSRINIGGNLSDFFTPQRGCRQGDPISSYLFLLCAEILAIKMRNNKNIKGIKVNKIEHVISQYADDTSLILDGTERSLHEALMELRWFEDISGLKVNFDKTQVIWIGSKKFSNERLCTNWNLNWGKTKFSLLGIDFEVDLTTMGKMNFNKKLSKIRSIITQWNKRDLTPIGRICIIKSLVISQLNHLFISLPNPCENILNELHKIIFNFLWNNGTAKIKKDIITKPYEDGGLDMINLPAYIKALKITWLRRILNSDGVWQNLLLHRIKLDHLLQFGIEYVEKVLKDIKNNFWKDVFISWRDNVRKKDNSFTEFNLEDILKSPIWYNSKIKINNTHIYLNTWHEKGILYINDLINEDGTLFTYEEFINKFHLNANFLEFEGLLQSIKALFRKHNIGRSTKLHYPWIPNNIVDILREKRGSKRMYNILRMNSHYPNSKIKWENIFREYNIQMGENEWTKIHKSIHFIDDPLLKWFQYRINHLILTTNKFAHKIGIYPSPSCTFCETEDESILHLLLECEAIQEFISHVTAWLADNDFFLNFDMKKYLIGPYPKELSAEHIVYLEIKRFIYRCKCSNNFPSVLHFKSSLKKTYSIRKYIATKQNRLEKFHDTWNNLPLLLLQ